MNETDVGSSLSLPATATIIITISIIMILNLFGNIMVLCVLYRQRKKPNLRVGNTFLANLSIVDILIGIILIPFSIAVAINGRDEVLNDSNCQLNGFINILVGSASIWTMAVISVDRYRAIVCSPGNRLQSHHARLLLVAVWLVSFAMAIAPILIFGRFKRSEKSINCKISSKIYLLLLSVMCFLLPLATMTYCYISIVRKVRMQRIQLQAWTLTNANMKKELKTAKIVFTVLATFVICWLPFVTVYILSVNHGIGKKISSGIFIFTGCLSAAHSACNPIIYFTMNKTFRNDLMEMLSCLQKYIARGNTMPKTGGQFNGVENVPEEIQ